MDDHTHKGYEYEWTPAAIMLAAHMDDHTHKGYYLYCLCRVMTSGREIVVTLKSTGCKGQDNEVNFLEHVILSIDMTYSRRGDLQILLTSPAGARNTSTLLTSVQLMHHSIYTIQVAELSHRDRAAGFISFGHKWKTIAYSFCAKRCRRQKTRSIDLLHGFQIAAWLR